MDGFGSGRDPQSLAECGQHASFPLPPHVAHQVSDEPGQSVGVDALFAVELYHLGAEMPLDPCCLCPPVGPVSALGTYRLK